MSECSQLKCRTPILCRSCGCQCPENGNVKPMESRAERERRRQEAKEKKAA